MKTAVAQADPPEPLQSSADSVKFQVRNLELYFDHRKCHALSGISMDIRANAVTAIIGPSGCGKSSLLKCLNRMHEKTPGTVFQVGGKILLDGEDIYSSQVNPVDLRCRVGMIFQQPNPFGKSIYENVAFGPRLKGIRKKAVLDGIVQEALEQANLWKEVKDILLRSGLSLSGGQQQRLCIARVLAMNPEVLLMDCPCSAIDPPSAQRIEDLMTKLKTSYTIIIVTHNIDQARRVSDWTAFLLQEDVGKPGQLIEFDRSTTIFLSGPNDKRTEDYIRGKFG